MPKLEDITPSKDSGGRYMKLPTEAKVIWLTALRSGDYAQAKEWLRTDKGFCCLGVLYEALGGKWDPQLRRTDDASYYATECNSSQLPEDEDYPVEVTKVLTQGVITPTMGFASLQATLANANDEGATFAEIADWIEANL